MTGGARVSDRLVLGQTALPIMDGQNDDDVVSALNSPRPGGARS